MKCPECGYKSDLGNHANTCSKRSGLHEEAQKPYVPPYFNKHCFLQCDWRPWNVSLTLADLRKLLRGEA